MGIQLVFQGIWWGSSATWLALESPWTIAGGSDGNFQPRYQKEFWNRPRSSKHRENMRKKNKRSPLSHFDLVSNSIQFICSSQEKCRTGSAWYLWRNVSLGKNTMAITGFAPLAPLASCPKSSPSVEVSRGTNLKATGEKQWLIPYRWRFKGEDQWFIPH